VNVPKPVCSSRSLVVVAKQLLPYRFDVYGHACTSSVIPKRLNSFAFQAVGNLARGLSLAFDGRIELAFGGHLSIVSAFRVTRIPLLGNVAYASVMGLRGRPPGLPDTLGGKRYGLPFWNRPLFPPLFSAVTNSFAITQQPSRPPKIS
jgi:hypothetical protein